MAVKILFQTQCCVDGCYAKKKKGHGMCAKHQADYDSGKRLMINYGAVVQKQPRAAIAEGGAS